jgi:hypothetical protein
MPILTSSQEVYEVARLILVIFCPRELSPVQQRDD